MDTHDTDRSPTDARGFARAMATPHRTLALAQGELAYYRFGRGPDLVALHGWPLHAATFRALLPFLTPHFTVHLVDLPGTGATRWRGPVDLRTDAAAVREAVDQLGLARYGLLAHDSGGVVARLLAAQDARVRALVLSGSEIPGHHPRVLKLYMAAGRIPGAAGLMIWALRFGVLRRSPLAFGAAFADPRFADGEFAELFVRPLVRDRRARAGHIALIRSIRLADIDQLREVHARIAAPTLCVWGDRDPFFPLAKARAMLPEFKGGAELVVLPGGRTFAHEEQPEAFAAHAVPFLARCLRAESAVFAA